MKNPALCGEIVNAVKSAVNIPVTVKIRKGFDDNTITAVEVAKACELKRRGLRYCSRTYT